jgi:hypothetical protein
VVNSDPRRKPPPPPPLNPPPQEKKSGEEKTAGVIPGAVNEYVMRAYATCRTGHEQDAMERALKLFNTQAKQWGFLCAATFFFFFFFFFFHCLFYF